MKKITILFLFAFVLLLSSCSSLQNMVNVNADGTPSWIANPPSRRGRISFVAEGVASTEDEARLISIKNVLLRISADLGWDAYTAYYRQMGSSGYVEDLDARIDNSWVRKYTNGTLSYFILVSVDEDLYASSRTEEYTRILERENEIKAYLDDAVSYYKQNMDVKALDAALDALLTSVSGRVNNQDYLPGNLLEEVFYYLEPLSIKASGSRNSADASIRVVRERGFFSPSVEAAALLIRYDMRNTNGNSLTDQISIVTDEKGRYSFHVTNPYILREGEVRISLDLDYDKLARIEALSPVGFLDEFYEMLNSKNIYYSYDIRNSSMERNLDVVVVSYGYGGEEFGSPAALQALDSYMKEFDLSITPIAGQGLTDQEIFDNYNRSSAAKKNVAIIRLSVVEIRESDSFLMARVEGSLAIYDVNMGEQTYFDDTTLAIGYGNSIEEASDDALALAARTISSILMIELM